MQPLAISAHITQAAHCRLDHVLLTFGMLFSRYTGFLNNPQDQIVCQAVLDSLSRRWSKMDQDVSVVAMILNPTLKVSLFNQNQHFHWAVIFSLFQRLWIRFYSVSPPVNLLTQLEDYMKNSGIFSTFPAWIDAEIEQAKQDVSD